MAVDHRAQLQSYYEAEARLDARPLARNTRRALLDRFVDGLRADGARSILDVGAGPGRDGVQFTEAGFECVGVDLAIGNARLAGVAGATVVPADALALPFRDRSFEAGWCMSVLMHFDADDAIHAFGELMRCLVPGAPICVSMWGARDESDHFYYDEKIAGERRPFYNRTLDANRAILERFATVIDVDVFVPKTIPYQVFSLRAPV